MLNIRHGKWAIKRRNALPKIWVRPIILAASICFLGLGTTMWDNIQLQSKLSTMQEEITTSFHRGLPNEPVIIDALAQLRQAAGQGGSTGSASTHITQQLNHISAVFKTQPWQMQELKIDSKGISISGKVENLDTLNKIRTELSAKTGADVQITDTDLSNNQVAFRIRWQ